MNDALLFLVFISIVSPIVGQVRETVNFASNDLTVTIGVIVAGVVAVTIVVVVLVFMIVTLCQICASERRELRRIRTQTRELKRRRALRSEIAQNVYFRAGRVTLSPASLTSPKQLQLQKTLSTPLNNNTMTPKGLPVTAGGGNAQSGGETVVEIKHA